MTPDELLTPERRAKAKEVQDLRREQWGHRVPTDPAHVQFRFGVTREQHAYNQLRALHDSGRPDAQKEDQLLNQAAEGKAAQGKFAEAASICKDEIARAEYEAKAKAFDGPRCSCPSKIQIRQPGNAIAREVDTAVLVARVWTGVEIVRLFQCSQCGNYFIPAEGPSETATVAGAGDQ